MASLNYPGSSRVEKLEGKEAQVLSWAMFKVNIDISPHIHALFIVLVF